MRVRVKGLSKSPQYNGLIGTIQGGVEGGRMRVVLDQTGKVLSLKRENLLEEPTGDGGEEQAIQSGSCVSGYTLAEKTSACVCSIA